MDGVERRQVEIAQEPVTDSSDSATMLPAASTRPRSANAVNTLIHLYRAEMGRLTTYRTRLDTTTNWAVSAVALIVTFTLGNERVSHGVLLLGMVLIYFFLNIEARRFRYYEASQHRLQLLEPALLAEVLEGKNQVSGDSLVTALRQPAPHVSHLGALGWRLRRNYLVLFGVMLVAWLSKLDLSGDPSILSSLDVFVSRASLGSIPGWIVTLLVAAFGAWLLILALIARHLYPPGDDRVREMTSTVPD